MLLGAGVLQQAVDLRIGLAGGDEVVHQQHKGQVGSGVAQADV